MSRKTRNRLLRTLIGHQYAMKGKINALILNILVLKLNEWFIGVHKGTYSYWRHDTASVGEGRSQ